MWLSHPISNKSQSMVQCGAALCAVLGPPSQVVHSMLTKRRIERLKVHRVDIPEVLQWLCKVRRTGQGHGTGRRARPGQAHHTASLIVIVIVIVGVSDFRH